MHFTCFTLERIGQASTWRKYKLYIRVQLNEIYHVGCFLFSFENFVWPPFCFFAMRMHIWERSVKYKGRTSVMSDQISRLAGHLIDHIKNLIGQFNLLYLQYYVTYYVFKWSLIFLELLLLLGLTNKSLNHAVENKREKGL